MCEMKELAHSSEVSELFQERHIKMKSFFSVTEADFDGVSPFRRVSMKHLEHFTMVYQRLMLTAARKGAFSCVNGRIDVTSSCSRRTGSRSRVRGSCRCCSRSLVRARSRRWTTWWGTLSTKGAAQVLVTLRMARLVTMWPWVMTVPLG